MANKITVTSAGTVVNANVTPDSAMYYSNKSKDWAISGKIVDNIDYSSKYYANESKKQADISTAKATEVVESGNTAVSNIESARDNAIMDVNTAGATQVALATEQATIATNKASEVVASGNTALTNIDTAKNNAITSITNQETTSKNVLIDEGATQVGLIQNEGAIQVANVQSTGFYMRDDKLYYINSQGEETEFNSGSGLELCDIGMALYVDETKGLRRYLNGQIVDINTNTQAFLNRLQEITTLHPSLLCTEEEWQTAKTSSAFGQVGKFVFNYSGADIVSVRLPRVVNVQGVFNLQNLGMTVGAGLPNITGTLGYEREGSLYVDGCVYFGGSSVTRGSFDGTNWGAPSRIDASRSNSIYGNSDTVQPEAIQYPYFIQIATGSETEANIVNTLENVNGFTLLESKYSDKPLYNESWLLSNGQQNAKAVYLTAYEGLQVEYNSEIEAGTTVTLPSGVSYTKRGLSVKLSTETYTDYDFVLNTAEETFRLPLKNHTADDGNSVLTLYFYIGETVQNANLIDAGRIGEQLATKTDMVQASGAGMPSTKYIDLTLGASGSTYTAPANGWFYLGKQSGSSGKYLAIYNSTSSGIGMTNHSSLSALQAVYVPVHKNDSIYISYTSTGATESFRFIYAEGSK